MKKTLVAYFSASGTTKKVAEKLASIINADLYEIIPEKLYTNADLDWQNSNSRSSVEKNNKNIRPAIANKVDNMDEYNTIFVGFPIWWYVAPNIINSFLEQYNLKGKTIVPFATSGMSKMGNTNAELEESCKGATLKDGERFDSRVSENELKKWAEKFI